MTVHRVRRHFWRNGRLMYEDQEFDSLDAAIVSADHASQNLGSMMVKIYDATDILVHSKSVFAVESSVYG